MNESIASADRLLAESVRHYEALQGHPCADDEATLTATTVGGDFERRIVNRAKHLGITPSLRQALQHTRRTTTLLIVGALFVAGILGASAARVALQPLAGEPLNFYWLLSGLLAVPWLTLLLWAGLLLLKPSVLGSGSLGGMLTGLARRLAQHWHHDRIHLAVIQTNADWLTGGAVGRWTLSAISHALWLVYLIAALVMTTLLLSVQQYGFAWETTILSADAYIRLTRTLASVPELLSFSAPDASQIIASRWNGGDLTTPADGAWSSLLLGSIIGYGILPRLFLLGLCLWLRRQALLRMRLDLEQPGYARLHDALMPTVAKLGIIDPDTEPHPEEKVLAEPAPMPLASGPIAIFGLEIDRPAAAWPPLEDGEWLDLGFVEDRVSRKRVLDALAEAEPSPRMIVIICSLAMTPDRGLRSFIERVRQTLPVPLWLLLSDGQRMRERGQGADLAQRSADWRTLAKNSGITPDHVLDMDLDHPTAASRAHLADTLGIAQASTPTTASIDECLARAFITIEEYCQRWRQPPDAAEQTELQRAIARQFDARRNAWRLPRVSLNELRHDLDQQLNRGEQWMSELLPARLQAQPRWLAAGAVAGALGCVAIATLTSPAAIAALPFWAGLGGALTLLRRPRAEAENTPQGIFTEAISAAALFALVLALQGRPEAEITRLLDEAIGHDDAPIDNATAARLWLARVQQRLKAALPREAA